ncbi:exo-alpha-sialidase [Helicobacter suis]|uniref:exo-alpha-sialidase n=1 Tax=Helicobacter suis TaxID=104628 RepID=UPI003D312DA5
MRSVLIYSSLLVLLFLGFTLKAPHCFSFKKPPTLTQTPPLFTLKTLPPPPVKSVHSATLSALSNDYLLAAYFGGSAEGLSDVKIYANLYSIKTQTWQKAFALLSAPELSKLANVYVKILGNPVLFTQHNRLYLFVVGVSLGGWATSRIYMLVSNITPPFHFSLLQILPLSPFLNISHLVRTAVLPTTDGGFVLPTYHELAHKFPLLLKFDTQDRLQLLIKPNTLKQQLQPTLAPYKSCALMALRSYKTQQFYTQTCKTPLQWNLPHLSNLHNYDNSIVLFNANHTLYLLYNQPLKNSNNPRSALYLAKFKDGYFSPLTILDSSLKGEVSYPAVLNFNNQIHVLYTKERKAIMHLSFNLGYLKQF